MSSEYGLHAAKIAHLAAEKWQKSEEIGMSHTTEGFSSAQEIAEAFQGKASDVIKEKIEQGEDPDVLCRWIYSRVSNPQCRLLESVLSQLEKTEGAAVFASGMAAISAVIEQYTQGPKKGENGEYLSGDKIVVIGTLYGGTVQRMHLAKQEGRLVEFMSIADFQADGLPADTKLVYFESVSNPTLEVAPIDDIMSAVKAIGGCVSVCDNTFTPLSVRPADHGVDFVVHSMTKALNGKSGNLGGVICGSEEKIKQLSDLHTGVRSLKGGVMAPEVAHEFLETIQSLPHRLLDATENARHLSTLAELKGLKVNVLANNSDLTKVQVPDVDSNVIGGLMTIDFGTREKAHQFVDQMIAERAGLAAVSLGAETTYFSIPADTTSSELTEEELAAQGISEGLVRISCGSEISLAQDFERVLKKL